MFPTFSQARPRAVMLLALIAALFLAPISGRAAAGDTDRITLTPSTSSVEAGSSQTYTVEAFDASNTSLGDQTAGASFAIAPDGSCINNVCTATVAGPHTVIALYNQKSAKASLSITPGKAFSITISPSSATIAAGTSKAFTVTGQDEYGNAVSNATESSTYAVTPNGACSANSCGATTAGPHTVTATLDGRAANASLAVDKAPLASLVITPSSATIAAGEPVALTAEGRDAFGNSYGNVTSSTAFSIAPNGTCNAAACTATIAGAHTVTGTRGSVTGSTPLTVAAGPLASLSLEPSNTVIALGDAQTYVTKGRDAFGNSLGDRTTNASLSIAPEGICSGAACTGAAAGPHTVTATEATTTGTATLTIVKSAVDHVEISPASSTIVAGQSRVFTAEGFDASNQSVGDVTASTQFQIAGGSCNANVCTATRVGPHQVTGTITGVKGNASLTVTPAAQTGIVLTPGGARIPSGGTQVFVVRGVDQYGNVTGDRTTASSFVIGPNGSCTGATCGASTLGTHTVTATDGSFSASVSVEVIPAAPSILTPAQQALSGGEVTVSGTAVAGQVVRIFEGGIVLANDLPTAADGSWTARIVMGSGTHSITAQAISGGQSGVLSAVRVFTVDATPPQVTISKPSPYVVFGTYTPLGGVQVRGGATDNIAVDHVELSYVDQMSGEQVRTATAQCQSCGTRNATWSDSPELVPGFYTVTVVAVDRTGSRSRSTSMDFVTFA